MDAPIEAQHQNQSPTLGALAAALAKAQGEMTGAKKDALNPHFKSKYADLASVWDACRAALSKNGLAVVQRVFADPAGVGVRTMLVHAGGEWIEEVLVVPVQQRSAQGYGSAVTYGRRYALAAMVGIAAEDDDGQAATENAPQEKATPATGSRTAQAREKTAAKVATLREQAEPPASSEEPDAWALISDLLKQHQIYGQKAVSVIKGATGKADRHALTMTDYEAVKDSLGKVGGILAPKP